VFQYLQVKDVNNVHLVCKHFHEIANLHVNPIFRLKEDSQKNLESLIHSSRIFEELEFCEVCDYYLQPGNFQMTEEFISFLGIHIKTLTIKDQKVDQLILLNLLNSLPNLRSLELHRVECANLDKNKWDLKVTKIERLKIFGGCTTLENLIESLENYTIKELQFSYWSESESVILQKFLKSQEKNLKKIIGINNHFLPNNLNDLRLDYLELSDCQFRNDSLDFLKQHRDLKCLKLVIEEFSNELLNAICELKNLKTLELKSKTNNNNRNGLNNLHKLKNLKRLKIDQTLCTNILKQLQFGVFNDLEELDAYFHGASVDYARKIKQIALNLKKINIEPR
jgi:hypothetical protein